MATNLLGKAMDKGFWAEVREKECFKEYRDHMLKVWNEDCEGVTLITHRYRDFKTYFTTGNRGPYSKTYYHRRRQLMASAILSLIYS